MKMGVNSFERFKSDYKKTINRRITTDIKRMVLYGCGLPKNVNYTMNSTIKDLIDNKYNNESERLKLYVSALDNIKELLNIKYPYVDFSNVNLMWTVKEIIDGIRKINNKKIPKQKIVK